MLSKSLFIPLTLLASLSLCYPATSAPIDGWNAIILEGSNYKFSGKYDLATQSFTKAVSLAKKQKLADKCLPISLCRLAEVELITNNVKEADSHFEQITNLIKTQKSANKLDPQVSFWAASLSDAYQSNRKPDTRELCLKHACYLKTLIYGPSHGECTDCLAKLADCYAEEGQVEKAIKLLSFRDALLEKQLGKNIDRYGDTLNDLAAKCEKQHKYSEAKEFELAVIKIAQTNVGSLRSGLPAFYSFLGINALVQNRSVQSKEYFKKALQECRKIQDPLRKKWIFKYLDPLTMAVNKAKPDYKLAYTETAYKYLLSIYDTIPTGSIVRFNVLSDLAGTIYDESPPYRTKKRIPEVVEYFRKAITMAELPQNNLKKELPYLYLRMGCCTLNLGKFDESREYFTKALESEPDKTGFPSTMIYFWWGFTAEDEKQWQLATKILNTTYTRAQAIPPEKRGTILADLLYLLASKARTHGDEIRAKELFRDSDAEIELQKKLKSKMGPDLYHRMVRIKKKS